MTTYTHDEAYRIAMAAGWDALIRAGSGEEGQTAAADVFKKVMAALGHPQQQEGE